MVQITSTKPSGIFREQFYRYNCSRDIGDRHKECKIDDGGENWALPTAQKIRLSRWFRKKGGSSGGKSSKRLVETVSTFFIANNDRRRVKVRVIYPEVDIKVI